MRNPYVGLPEQAFWKTGVASRSLFDLQGMWNPKFNLRPTDKFVTFGSCFAQHIGRALTARGFVWYNAEPAPEQLSAENAKKFNYNIFSARTGNIYTTSLLLQWTRWALGEAAVPEEYWEQDGRIFDPFRPAIEPNGFASVAEMVSNRGHAIAAFRDCIETAQYFVFTMGLTESWKNARDGYEYPMCPGTLVGTFDPAVHEFKNLQFSEIAVHLKNAIDLMHKVNRKLRFILTVSPVPLTATKSGRHVLFATMESKSTLRTAAAHFNNNRPDVDYFPSYELISSPPIKGIFFEPNMREVNPRGVAFVMDSFFNDLKAKFGEPVAPVPPKPSVPQPAGAVAAKASKKSNDEVVCEEELLEAFGN